MAGSALSRRLSEIIGVALFALAIIWLIALASYSAADPVWFFITDWFAIYLVAKGYRLEESLLAFWVPLRCSCSRIATPAAMTMRRDAK